MPSEIFKVESKLSPYGKYIEQAITSSVICDYLKEEHMSVDDIIDVIFYSPVMTLQEKKDAIVSLSAEICDGKSKLKAKCMEFNLYLTKALELLGDNAVFSLESVSFDSKTGEQESCFEGIFATYDDVLDEVNLWEDEDYWFEVKVWDKSCSGKMQEMATYILVKGRPVYCDLEEVVCQQIEGISEADYYQFSMLSMTDLNIPIPFQPGDIVEVGSAPFTPRFRVLITDIGDNFDCCCIQGMCISEDGKCNIGAVKHGHVGKYRRDCYIMPSLLYEMTLYEGRLDDNEEVFRDLSYILKHV